MQITGHIYFRAKTLKASIGFNTPGACLDSKSKANRKTLFDFRKL